MVRDIQEPNTGKGAVESLRSLSDLASDMSMSGGFEVGCHL